MHFYFVKHAPFLIKSQLAAFTVLLIWISKVVLGKRRNGEIYSTPQFRLSFWLWRNNLRELNLQHLKCTKWQVWNAQTQVKTAKH